MSGTLELDGIFVFGALLFVLIDTTSGSGTSSTAKSSNSSGSSSSSEDLPDTPVIPDKADEAPALPGPEPPALRNRESTTARMEYLSVSLKTLVEDAVGTPAKVERSNFVFATVFSCFLLGFTVTIESLAYLGSNLLTSSR